MVWRLPGAGRVKWWG